MHPWLRRDPAPGPELVGVAKAKQLVLYLPCTIKAGGRPSAIGLVDADVHPAEELMPAALALAGTIAKNAPYRRAQLARRPSTTACSRPIDAALQVEVEETTAQQCLRDPRSGRGYAAAS